MTSCSPLLYLLLALGSVYEACRSGGHGQNKTVEIEPGGSRSQRMTKDGCRLSINSELVKESPLLLKARGPLDGHRFVLPGSDSDVLSFKPGQGLLLACPGNGNAVLVNKRQKPFAEVTATCQSGTKFVVDGAAVELRHVTCRAAPDPSTRQEGSCHGDRHQLHSVGFQLGAGFLRLLDVCFDAGLRTTLYVRFDLVTGAEHRQRNLPRLGYFRKATHFRNIQPPIDKVYNCANGQHAIFQSLLGSAELASRYISCDASKSSRLEKGHLAAYADFVYAPQQWATLYYVNTVPQWEKLNAGNWKVLEERVRRVARAQTDLVVYAGGLNVSRLRDAQGNQRPLFLALDSNRNPVLPVPQTMYRVVLERGAKPKRGIAFLAINTVAGSKADFICPDVCDQAPSFFKGWNRLDPARGLVYCCSVRAFLAASGLGASIPGKDSALLT